jgi:hypothetical protein
MKLWTSALLVLMAALPARAHFIWLLPPGGSGDKAGQVRVIFSDNTEPDRPELLARIAKTKLFVRGRDNKEEPLKWTKGKDAYEISVPGKGPRLVLGVCRYGVFQHGKEGPFLLFYYPATYLDPVFKESQPPDIFTKPCDRLALQILLPIKKGQGRVLWHGKPVAEAEVVILAPGKDKGVTSKTDSMGRFTLVEPKGQGLYGIRVRHVEPKTGEYQGKKYKEERHYATLVMRVSDDKAPRQGKASGEKSSVKADPAATKLLAEARKARVNWEDFPGFTADLTVNFAGKVSKGKVIVQATGRLKLELTDAAMRSWAQGVLGSTVAHRLDNSAELKTPCAFADDVTDHPLGRAIRVLNDEFHSSYRIRDRQVIVVNREMKSAGIRFTITVMENRLNKEKRYLPKNFVVHTWDTKTGALRSSEDHHQTWKRVGKFDLPLATTVVTATAGKVVARSLKLSNFQLTAK